MDGSITIQWCSNCKVWAKCKRICKEVMQISESGPATGQTARCDHYECQACFTPFQTRHVRTGHTATWTLALSATLARKSDPPALQPA